MPKKFTTNTKVQKANEIKLKNKSAKQQQESDKKESKQQEQWKDDTKKSLRDEQRKQKQESDQLKKQMKAQISKELEQEQDSFSKNKPKPVNSKLQQKNNIPKYGASNIDDALKLLSITTSNNQNELGSITVDKHPEKRQRQRFQVFEERKLEELKKEFPHLRLSQLKQKIYKEWQKSPENPFNQSSVSYNTNKEDLIQMKREIKQDIEKDLRLE